MPPTRPLMMEFPDDKHARGVNDQFMLGDDLMMAPILHKRTTSRSVYFPQGVWTHFFTQEEHDFSQGGGRLYNLRADIGTPLVFVKKSNDEIIY